MIALGASTDFNVPKPISFKGYDNVVRILDRANNTLISPKKLCYIGNFVLDLETGVSESNSKQVTNKAVESGFTVSEGVIDNLATVSVTGYIADYAFNNGDNSAGGSDAVGDIRKMLKMVKNFSVDNLYSHQKDKIDKAAVKVQNTLDIVRNTLDAASDKNALARNLKNGVNKIIAGSSSERSFVSRSQKQIALLKSLFDCNSLVEFACEFTYYPQMIITQLDISRDDVRDGSFIVNISLQEFLGVEVETADLDSAQFAKNLSRNDIQCLVEENIGEQKIEQRASALLMGLDSNLLGLNPGNRSF